ncbi:PqqD family protein [Xanthomonas theicola]|uniref:PqqD family protein n=2 Tax=Xanthomonas theicola TaxID=56464 RepID=A0A2S6ZB24_9XANT|nr:PqqD family protein [Xanthomonas theicola]QNH27123.1 PqqD family protein [Xanthomonas theicola]
MQLISAVHLQPEEDGGAIVIDDRTLTAAYINKAAYVILQALHQPCTKEHLVVTLAEAANCDLEDAAAPVIKLIDELTELGWLSS